jgi:hypothetical protein
VHFQLYFLIPKLDAAYLMAMRHEKKKHDTGPVEGTGCVSGPDPGVSETFGRTRFRLYDSSIEVYDVVSYLGGLG